MLGIASTFAEAVDAIFGRGGSRFVQAFWIFVFLEVPRYLLTDLVVAIHHAWPRRRPARADANVVRTSVVLAALNEEDTIALTIRSLLEQDHGDVEIIVVDDGSSDRTAAICEAFAASGAIRFLRFERRQGKAAALNYGTRFATGAYVVYMDSDSTLDRDAVRKLVRPFRDPAVGAVGGTLGVRNAGTNLLTGLQSLEYLISIALGRRFRALVGTLSVVAGAFGAFRRELLDPIGGHSPGPGNDSDLTIRVRKAGFKIAFAHDAVCLTNVPTTWRAWAKQRSRWDRNLIRNRVRKHRDVFALRWATFAPGTLFSFVDAIFFGSVLSVLWLGYLVHATVTGTHSLVFVLANLILYTLMKIAQVMIALPVSVRRREHAVAVLALPLFVPYRIVSRIVRIWAHAQELVTWRSYRDAFAPAAVRAEIPRL